MATKDSTPSGSGRDADQVQQLRDQRASVADDDPRAADLDRQIRDAEQSQQPGGQSGR